MKVLLGLAMTLVFVLALAPAPATAQTVGSPCVTAYDCWPGDNPCDVLLCGGDNTCFSIGPLSCNDGNSCHTGECIPFQGCECKGGALCENPTYCNACTRFEEQVTCSCQ